MTVWVLFNICVYFCKHSTHIFEDVNISEKNLKGFCLSRREFLIKFSRVFRKYEKDYKNNIQQLKHGYIEIWMTYGNSYEITFNSACEYFFFIN